MAVDAAVLGELVADLMDRLEGEYGDTDGVELIDAVVIVELADDNEDVDRLRWRATTTRTSVLAGIGAQLVQANTAGERD